ncbi:MAG: 4-hydroxy-tetrahydrodipicolinate reductase [Spirochaetes bacterium ADurb.Bin110]|nr:MAG: 4-hydroxy-tetrahydrodipicolinate reductase [Spirochaetes bacterium ADurb.Bin110]
MTMNIGIFGAGKLAHAIVEEVQANNAIGFSVAWMVDKGETIPDSYIDVAIDASSADAVESHIDWAIQKGIPFVIATTGWDIPDLAARVGEKTGVLVSPNFSFAVAFMLRIASQLARFADWYSDGEIAIFEHHHSAKKDAPSGTAKALARAIISSSTRYTGWNASGAENWIADKIPIASLRAGTETGVHEILFDAPHEQLSMIHRARDRRVFAAGALKAAQWILGRKGLFGMEDVLNDLFS